MENADYKSRQALVERMARYSVGKNCTPTVAALGIADEDEELMITTGLLEDDGRGHPTNESLLAFIEEHGEAWSCAQREAVISSLKAALAKRAA